MALSGLVSYGSSDESESENETEIEPSTSGFNGDCKNVDDMIDDSVVEDTLVGPTLPASLGLPKPKYGEIETIQVNDENSVGSVLSSLPKAQKTEDNFKVTNDEVEEEFRKLPKNAELPKPPKKSGKVKISLPSLSYSDDEDEPKAKKVKITPAGKSGLLGMLPQPKRVSVKETNRPLVPHTLTKKPTVKPQKPMKIVDVASDSDDEESNFFSLNEPSTSVKVPSVIQSTVQSTPVIQPEPSLPEPVRTEPALDEYLYSEPATSTADQNVIDFESHQNMLQDEQFKRMVGKNFRGQELLDIMDVRAEDQMSNQIEMTRSLTEEKSNMSYSKKRKDLPSQLSRRKHQITYLAFQAKERELELKNQWSQNKSTKRQTQAKYGF